MYLSTEMQTGLASEIRLSFYFCLSGGFGWPAGWLGIQPYMSVAAVAVAAVIWLCRLVGLASSFSLATPHHPSSSLMTSPLCSTRTTHIAARCS